MRTILMAPLGPQPQALTFCLALLRRQNVVVDELAVVHTDAEHEPMRSALARLWPVLAECRPRLRVRQYPILAAGRPLSDVVTAQQARAYLNTFYLALLELKQQRATIHMSVAGVRKLMTMYAMVAAQLLFDEGDRLWHLYTAPEVIQRGEFWPRPGDETMLVEVPVLRWSAAAPVLTRLGAITDPWDAVHEQEEQRRRTALALAATFVEQRLTRAEREVAALVMTEGFSNAEIAARLHKTEKTVVHQMSSILRKLAEHFALSAEATVDRTTLVRLVGGYYLLR